MRLARLARPQTDRSARPVAPVLAPFRRRGGAVPSSTVDRCRADGGDTYNIRDQHVLWVSGLASTTGRAGYVSSSLGLTSDQKQSRLIRRSMVGPTDLRRFKTRAVACLKRVCSDPGTVLVRRGLIMACRSFRFPEGCASWDRIAKGSRESVDKSAPPLGLAIET